MEKLIEEFKQIIVQNADKNETVYTYLRKNNYSETYTKHLRKVLGYIKVNGNDEFIICHVKNGDIINVYKNPNTRTCIQNCIIPLDIVFEDEDIAIINKPSNLACMPTKSHYEYNLAGAITNYFQQKNDNFVCRILNRLDKDTAGLVMIAKNAYVCNMLNNDNVLKTYYAICEGNMKKKTDVSKNIFTSKDENNINIQKREVSDDEGKPAITHIFPIKNYKNFFLAKITLEHGRTHQIRAHLSSINHPLVGDKLYGQESVLIDHSALVCKEITFLHPISKKLINVEIDYPEDFVKLIRN